MRYLILLLWLFTIACSPRKNTNMPSDYLGEHVKMDIKSIYFNNRVLDYKEFRDVHPFVSLKNLKEGCVCAIRSWMN